jgi:type IV pilus assembly protein PilE
MTTMPTQVKPTERGFTLIELMITVAIVAILTAIAVPSYNQYVLRSHRAEAKNTLLSVAQRLEQNYTLSGSYARTQGAAADDIDGTDISDWGLNQVPLSGAARYTITFAAGSPTTTAFTLQATPVGAQVSDTTCGILMLDNRNLKGAVGVLDNRSQVTRDCWDR